MIAYMPEIYNDELLYSWFCRYYVHCGYPAYVYALEDLLEKRNGRIDMEFGGKLNKEALRVIDSMYDRKKLIYEHTMYPEYARFASFEKQKEAMKILLSGEGNIHNVLTFPALKGKKRYLRYCPVCAEEDRNSCGETYWHRVHQMNHLQLCPRHGCRLRESTVGMSASKSPRLWPAEEVIPAANETAATAAESTSSLEIQLANYAADLLQYKLPESQSSIHEWLVSRLEGTAYISVSGKCRYISRLYSDVSACYQNLPDTALSAKHQLEKLLTGYNSNFFAVCQLAFFLGIPLEELAAQTLPEKSMTERYNEKIQELQQSGMGCYRIAKELGCSPSSVVKSRKRKEKAEHNYAVRKGSQKADWCKMDKESLPTVQTVCNQLYGNTGERPHRVTENAVTRAMGWPGKRLQYLPKCRKLVQTYQESIEMFWARECIWAFNQLKSEQDDTVIRWRQLRDMTNIRRCDFESCKKHIYQFADEQTASAICRII